MIWQKLSLFFFVSAIAIAIMNELFLLYFARARIGRAAGPAGPPQQPPAEPAGISEEVKFQAEVLQFLYEKRESQFNLRRDHEWKVFFGVITLIGAVDAAILTQKICLQGAEWWVWLGGLSLFAACCIAYEFGVQQRNRMERLAMDQLYRRLAWIARATDASVRSRLDYHTFLAISEDEAAEQQLGWGSFLRTYTYMWAFWWQSVVIIFVVLVSLFIPGKICSEKKQDAAIEIKLTRLSTR